jgi:hypothetical protein
MFGAFRKVVLAGRRQARVYDGPRKIRRQDVFAERLERRTGALRPVRPAGGASPIRRLKLLGWFNSPLGLPPRFIGVDDGDVGDVQQSLRRQSRRDGVLPESV